ncbi:malonyl-ACP O-methyltransferase BioC [uncultured Zhongshania sp.]|jgi:malonyl-CoA O-methyltransferase|uniref:malonyl-ACP O-methyltransferase BioC n=1 Tax=uncultured Zhongshania sp. TaxID=1642288 RepID=UPI0025FAF70B|nr:malonyl-ACP O-methyltransferase BioC [uncultured Zhongshania sp.]
MTVIYREHLAAYRSGAAELVLLHGWASDSDVWRSVIPALRRHFHITLIDLPGFGRSEICQVDTDVKSIVEQLLSVLPERAIYCGWSLGGMFATAIAAAHPERVSALITVASNAVFVADDSWPAAMPREDFLNFKSAIEKNMAKGLRRFALLQLHGDKRTESVQAVVNRLAPQQNSAGLLQGLKYLSDIDNRLALTSVVAPVLHVLGSNDAIVPIECAALIARHYPNHDCEVMRGCGHIPFLSLPEKFLEILLNFVNDKGLLNQHTPYLLDKSDVGRSFSRAASSYDGAALLQRRIADRLLSILPGSAGASLVDLGCGTGYSLPALRRYVGEGQLIAADLAPGMLAFAKEHAGGVASTWLCTDAEDLALADNSVGQIFSSLALQWCENLPAVYAEIERVLTPGGTAVIATLGPETLHELRESWRQVDSYAHVNQFATRSELDDAIQYSGLQVEEWREVGEQMEYQRLSELTRELKNIGAHNVNSRRPSGLTSRGRIAALTSAYEKFRMPNGYLPATYQVWYLRCKKIG